MLQLAHPAVLPMLAAVRAAAHVTRSVQEDLVKAQAVAKDDRSPVTVADYAAQAVVSHFLELMVDEIPLVGEESSELLRKEENREVLASVLDEVRPAWPDATEEGILEAIDRGHRDCDGSGTYFTLDPIDGTKGFLRGEHYAVALALLQDGEVTAGVLACPNLRDAMGRRGVVFVAARGRGAIAMSTVEGDENAAAVRVSDRADPTRTRFCESVVKAHTNRGRAAEVADLLGVTADPVHMDSQCKYGLVGRGDAELYLRIPRDDVYRERIWDHAAGVVLVEEAGGRVTDVDGRPLDFTKGLRLEANRGVVASNGPIHDAVIEALRQTE